MRMPAQRLYAADLVNRLYPRGTLATETLAFASEIAKGNAAALRQAKRSVDITMDIAGQHSIANRFAEALDGESSPVPSRRAGNGSS